MNQPTKQPPTHLSNFMVECSWEANNHSSSQETPNLKNKTNKTENGYIVAWC